MNVSSLLKISLEKPKLLTVILVVLSLSLGAFISKVKVDTDPENMLAVDEPVRVFHDKMKKEFALNDFVVLGIVNDKHPDGVFNKTTLKRVHELTEFVKNMHDPDNPDIKVITRNIIAPGTVDAIEQAGLGQVRFDWLMERPPQTEQDIERIRDLAMHNPLLKGTLVSEDEKAIGIYIPVSVKDFAAQVRRNLLDRIEEYDKSNGDDFHITGLPVAEDTFGEEMFVQMAVSAPLAMLAIFLLMFLFFRSLKLIVSPMIVALMSVLCSMGLLVGTGNTLHIMSSMIPIFLMPIAVVDSVHILSEFFDTYRKIGDRRKTIEHVMDQLFMPMLYTSLTSSAGFASLALTPIPPVQAFGIFVAIGIMLAWLFTILFIPAYVMMLSEESLKNFGAAETDKGQSTSIIARYLQWLGGYTYSHAKLIITASLVILVVAFYGITKIQVNDNPVKWFTESHPIRVADRVLNDHFGGTYEAYLVFESELGELTVPKAADMLRREVGKMQAGDRGNPEIYSTALSVLDQVAGTHKNSLADFLSELTRRWENNMFEAPDATYDIWGDLVDRIASVRNRGQVFKQPAMLEYLGKLERHLQQTGVVGKSNSVADLVKKVHQELFQGDEQYYTIPDSVGGVAETLISFQNSHKPDDLWHFVTPDYTKANLWVQLKEGDNKVMEAVVREVEKFIDTNPPPLEVSHQWAGLTYLNVVWQDKMVNGMFEAFASSFVVVLVMMTILFRSLLWGILAMVPLSVTIAFIYGLIGLIGKDYDMPVAVLSSLTLGLAVDFAIHFLERSRMTHKKHGSWKESVKEMFEEPARAITRNVIVIAVGFTPLLAAPLVPYKTVGIFLAGIMAVSGVATMFILPSLITIFDRFLFKR